MPGLQRLQGEGAGLGLGGQRLRNHGRTGETQMGEWLRKLLLSFPFFEINVESY